MNAPAAAIARTAPGTALCLAGGILTLATAIVPAVSFLLGAFALFNGWRASRAARKHPDRYRASAVPLAGTVLVLIAWAFAGVVVLLMAAASPDLIHPDPSSAEKW